LRHELTNRAIRAICAAKSAERSPEGSAPRRRKGQRNSTSPDIITAIRHLVLIANDDLIAGILNWNKLRPRQPMDPRARDGAAISPQDPLLSAGWCVGLTFC